MKKITISFKSTERDTALHEIIKELDDKSFHIKEALRQYFKEELKKKEKELEKEKAMKMKAEKEAIEKADKEKADKEKAVVDEVSLLLPREVLDI